MKYDLIFGKKSKNGRGDIDIPLANNIDLKDADWIVAYHKKQILDGWCGVRKGDRVEVWAVPLAEVGEENEEFFGNCDDWVLIAEWCLR